MRFPLAILVLACSCARPGVASVVPGCPGSTIGTPALDSLRGVVEIVGSEPGTAVALVPATGRAATLVGERSVLVQLQGVEVVVYGTRAAAGALAVQRVIVRALSGEAAHDGVLLREPTGDVLLTCDGQRLTIGRLPEALRNAAGTRVWLVGPLAAPTSYGIIRP